MATNYFNITFGICTCLGGNDEIRIYARGLNNLSDYMDWIRVNQPTLVYQLETPVYEPLKIPATINLHEDVTTISNDSIIPVNIKVIVDRVVNIAKKYVEVAKNSPTISNIELARIWANQIPESIFKDELQYSINTILDVVDMTMERKSVTANVDVYIKTLNSLSLSLDTNSISFDNFSGVDDMEKRNAVNLTVSSSLPYKIKAYLATEIQNADISKTMDKSILNIKVNSEATYKMFSDTVSPITLLDNQIKGNDISHGIDLKLRGNIAHKKDVYKTTIKFEVEQK